jgi:hypothetical protein
MYVWREGVHLSLEAFSNKPLPSSIYLCGGGAGLPDIREALTDPSWTEGLSFAEAPHIRYLQPGDITGVMDETEKLTTPQDIAPMALARLAVDLMLEEKELTDILRRSVRDRGSQKE